MIRDIFEDIIELAGIAIFISALLVWLEYFS